MHDPKQSGMVLVVVLWVVASLALLVAAFNASVKSSVVLVASEASLAHEHVLINAGLELAMARLKLVEKTQQWQADGRAYEVNFAGRVLRIKLFAANGRIDINKSSSTLLLGLLSRHTETPTQAQLIRDRILDWRDKDHKTRQMGAEDLEYTRAGRTLGAGDARFTTVTQLRNVLGVSYDLYKRIRPSLTLYSRTGLINPMSASREVLLSLPDITEAEVDQVMVLRTQGSNNKAAILNLLANSRKWLSISAEPAYVISIEVKAKHGRYNPPTEITVLTDADNQMPYRVLEWRRK